MKKAIGILGGMGPEASEYLYKTLIHESINHFNARNNEDFPEIVLYSVPVPDFISSHEKKSIALSMLKDRVRKMNLLDVSSIGIACNTAHILLSHLSAESQIPFISMIDEVVRNIDSAIYTVGLLGTPSTITSQMYQVALQERNIQTIVPNKKEQQILEKIIRSIIAGRNGKKDIKNLTEIADNLARQGAEGIILGCTELPLIFPPTYFVPVYNSVTILATTLLRNYYK